MKLVRLPSGRCSIYVWRHCSPLCCLMSAFPLGSRFATWDWSFPCVTPPFVPRTRATIDLVLVTTDSSWTVAEAMSFHLQFVDYSWVKPLKTFDFNSLFPLANLRESSFLFKWLREETLLIKFNLSRQSEQNARLLCYCLASFMCHNFKTKRDTTRRGQTGRGFCNNF